MGRKKDVDAAIGDFVAMYGIDETLAALCRHCELRGMKVLFRKLNRVYEWLVDKR